MTYYKTYGGWRESEPVKSRPAWQRMLDQARHDAEQDFSRQSQYQREKPAVTNRVLCYVIDRAASLQDHAQGLVVELGTRKVLKDGSLDVPKRINSDNSIFGTVAGTEDEVILQMLNGAAGEYGYASYHRRWVIPSKSFDLILRRMCQTGRCVLRLTADGTDVVPLTWDDGPPWRFELSLTPAEPEAGDADSVARTKKSPTAARKYEIKGWLVRDAVAAAELDSASENSSLPARREPIDRADIILRGGMLILDGAVAKFDHGGAFELAAATKSETPTVPAKQAPAFLKSLFNLARVPRLSLPPELRLTLQRAVPKPRLHIGTPRRNSYGYTPTQLPAAVSFDYQGRTVFAEEREAGQFVDDETVLLRDRDAEAASLRRLVELGFRQEWDYEKRAQALGVDPKRLTDAVLRLTAEGWHVEADGKLYHQPGEFKLELNASGIDWFDLDGKMDFGGQLVALPRLLEALRNGTNTVTLDDGSLGLLPQSWLKKYGVLAGVGTEDGESLRFSRTRVGLLDALLAAMPEAKVDKVFTHARKQLAEFSSVKPADPPATFTGALRPYQRDGLGWLHFLQQFNFGGCLADDMGLGKTVQVLALLEARRLAKAGPSLVVLPRSLVFNWVAEAARFAPQLKVLDQTGANRVRGTDHLKDYNLVLSTYGTLRKDAGVFKDFEFDYVILDEAQAIKNATTESAKAARLLRGRHRLAMSGTPVENRLAELWSLFEFLNPGMLGGAAAFSRLTAVRDGENDPLGRQILARTLRPFILRRTKAQVATDLPEKTEQTVYCELDGAQRELYGELKEHYRQSLLGTIERQGLKKSKIQVLEALLRLRQAACHPGLLDKSKVGESSAKLDTLLEQLEDVLAEGHKALVFSQFTSLLAIVKKKLDAANVRYEYLDGKTRDRDERVKAFHDNAKCGVFLISLKAGGVGLNLTGADYVFLLDPWWNPAVEAQAIDRAHRIGQTRRVFAYRLIAKGTVEEKVLELQKTKKDLADAIINADNGLIGSLTKEDLQLLLA